MLYDVKERGLFQEEHIIRDVLYQNILTFGELTG